MFCPRVVLWRPFVLSIHPVQEAMASLISLARLDVLPLPTCRRAAVCQKRPDAPRASVYVWIQHTL